MNIVVERSIVGRVSGALFAVFGNWKISFEDFKVVDDITTEPFQQIDFIDSGKHWKLIFPTTGGTCFFIDYNLHKDQNLTYAGGATGDGNRLLDTGDKVSIIVYGDESNEVLELRIVHELLHGADLPADSLLEYLPKFLNFWERLVFWWMQRSKVSPEQRPVFQRRFYKWLLLQRNNGVM